MRATVDDANRRWVSASSTGERISGRLLGRLRRWPLFLGRRDGSRNSQIALPQAVLLNAVGVPHVWGRWRVLRRGRPELPTQFRDACPQRDALICHCSRTAQDGERFLATDVDWVPRVTAARMTRSTRQTLLMPDPATGHRTKTCTGVAGPGDMCHQHYSRQPSDCNRSVGTQMALFPGVSAIVVRPANSWLYLNYEHRPAISDKRRDPWTRRR